MISKSNFINKKIRNTLTLVTFLAFLPNSISAQVIFHVDASGPQYTTSLNRTYVDSGVTERLISSSALNFKSAHYIQSEDSLLLWTGSDIYKTSRDFKSSRFITSLKNSWSNINTAFDTEKNILYYNFSSIDEDWIFSLDLISGQADTVTTILDGVVTNLAYSDFGITYTLSLGFENIIVHKNFEGVTDTLYSIERGSFEKILVDESNKSIYFVHEICCTTSKIYQMNIDGSEVKLVAEKQDRYSDLMIDSTNQKLYIRYSNKSVTLLDLNTNPLEETELFTSDYRIDRTFLDPLRNRIVFFSLGGAIIEYDIDGGEFINTAIFKPNENVLLLDERNEIIYYFAYVNAQSALYSINYNGENPQLISKFNDIYVATDARDAKLDTLNGNIYFITVRAVNRISLEPGSVEETLISYPRGTSLRAIDLNIEKEQLYIYKENDGIYSLSFDGESEAIVTTEGRFENNGLAYNSEQDKIYYTSNRHYMVNPDGSELLEWPRFSTLEVNKLMYNKQSNQLLMLQQDVNFDGRLNPNYEGKIRYLNFDESNTTGIYANVTMTTSYRGITAFTSSFPENYSSVGTFSEAENSEKPNKVHLSQNYPNPFNPSTTISFHLPISEQVSLKVFDMLGREVAVLLDSESMTAGSHRITFNAENQPSGVYVYRLKAGSQMLTKKLTLIK